MADYEITVTQRTKNPQYVPNENSPYYDRRSTDQQQEYRHRVLSVTLTEEEFLAVKQAVVRFWTHEERPA